MDFISQSLIPFYVLLFVWTLPWKIYSLWTAAHRGEIKWFIALLVLNTLAILDIIYIFWVAKKSWKDIKKDLKL